MKMYTREELFQVCMLILVAVGILLVVTFMGSCAEYRSVERTESALEAYQKVTSPAWECDVECERAHDGCADSCVKETLVKETLCATNCWQRLMSCEAMCAHKARAAQQDAPK
jgi:hypothetical protein